MIKNFKEYLNEKNIRASETLLIGITLALVGGFLDAYTYGIRGHVFANAQTGNVVLMGISMTEGNGWDALSYFLPILAFCIGVYISEYLKRAQTNVLHWRQVSIVIEIIVLSIVAFLKAGALDYVSNVAISFVCSLQVQAFRQVYGSPFASTMCTGNLRSGMEYFYGYLKYRDVKKRQKMIHYFTVIGAFIIGVGMGTLLTGLWSERAVLFCNLLLLFVFMLLFAEEQATKNCR